MKKLIRVLMPLLVSTISVKSFAQYTMPMPLFESKKILAVCDAVNEKNQKVTVKVANSIHLVQKSIDDVTLVRDSFSVESRHIEIVSKQNILSLSTNFYESQCYGVPDDGCVNGMYPGSRNVNDPEMFELSNKISTFASISKNNKSLKNEVTGQTYLTFIESNTVVPDGAYVQYLVSKNVKNQLVIEGEYQMMPLRNGQPDPRFPKNNFKFKTTILSCK